MFSNAVKICTIDDFDIRIDPSWLIIASLITWSLSQSYFPRTAPGLNEVTYLVMALVAMLGLFASLIAHELAHSIIARRLGVPIKTITLFLFGGVAELEAEPTSAKVEFLVAIAGPVMSLLLAIFIWALSVGTMMAGAITPFAEVLSYLALINLALALFNMIPAFPLDGGRMLRAYLWHRHGDALAATRTAAKSGSIFAYALMIVGIMSLFQGGIVGGIWYLLIGGFVLIAARISYANQLAKSAFRGKTAADLMHRAPVTVSPGETLQDMVDAIMLERGISFLPVVENEVLLGHIDWSVLDRIDRENWANTRVGDVFIGLGDAAMVAPQMHVSELFRLIQSTGRRKFMVVQDHALLGVITLSDLSKHLGKAYRNHPS
ncbi:site-2 protease family protein [Sulfitobacter sp. S190]|uniref:site-2 protease family protein n=1 Tax=Sulfitobacter sp. S190 TaxID=2867022 RepID=UPI0021A336F6|nr:site-2 protease family protein [Sulfitobacter sp. S190]UWR21832.1 site-2 protease family protein [Sulfitobacter sp. S190]